MPRMCVASAASATAKVERNSQLRLPLMSPAGRQSFVLSNAPWTETLMRFVIPRSPQGVPEWLEGLGVARSRRVYGERTGELAATVDVLFGHTDLLDIENRIRVGDYIARRLGGRFVIDTPRDLEESFG